jgi:hypothetical protein
MHDAMRHRKLLLLVSELHVRGYQRLRIAPGMAPSGMSWRCAIAPAQLFDPETPGVLRPETFESPLVARYGSGEGDRYFGWDDARRTTASGLARRFIERFPEIVDAGRGSDWAYAGWYVEMLHLTYPNLFPYAYSDNFDDEPGGGLSTVAFGQPVRKVKVPYPPPAA